MDKWICANNVPDGEEMCIELVNPHLFTMDLNFVISHYESIEILLIPVRGMIQSTGFISDRIQ